MDIFFVGIAILVVLAMMLAMSVIEMGEIKTRLEVLDDFRVKEHRRRSELREEIIKLIAGTYQRKRMRSYIDFGENSFSSGPSIEDAVNALIEKSGCDLRTELGTDPKVVLVKKKKPTYTGTK